MSMVPRRLEDVVEQSIKDAGVSGVMILEGPVIDGSVFHFGNRLVMFCGPEYSHDLNDNLLLVSIEDQWGDQCKPVALWPNCIMKISAEQMGHVKIGEGRLSAVRWRGMEISVYDDGDGPMWLYENSQGLNGVVRARDYTTAWGICEDEFLEEAPSMEELRGLYSTITLSGFDLWKRDNPKGTRLEWNSIPKVGQRNGEEVAYVGEIYDHPRFQEEHGFRPNGPNKGDVHKHGIYMRDLSHETLTKLTPEKMKENNIELEYSYE